MENPKVAVDVKTGVLARWRSVVAFAGFTFVFAFFAACVFWGCWATGSTFIAPDDPVVFYTSFGDTFVAWLNKFLTSGKVLPSDLLFSGLLGSPLFCRELKYVFAVYFAALAMAYFLRAHSLGLLSSYGAGLLLAFSGYWFTLFSAGHAGWFVWMTYGVFVFGLMERALKAGYVRHWLMLGLSAAWGSYHQPDLWLIFTAFSGFYFIFRAIVLRANPKNLAKGSLLAALVFFLAGAPSFRHALTSDLSGRDKQIAESKGTALTGGESADDSQARWIFVTNWSLPLCETSEFLCSRINGDTSCPFVLSINASKGVKPYVGAIGRPYKAESGNYRQHSVYVGWVTCLFAAIAVLSLLKRRNSVLAFFACAAVVFWLFSLGRYCPAVYRVVYSLPFGDYLRAPVKWHHLTEFCICVLSGFGMACVLSAAEYFVRGNAKAISAVRCAVALLVFAGVADLAFEAKRYCAVVDYSRALRTHSTSQLAVLSRQQLISAQVSEMVRNGQIVSVSNWLGNPDAYLVQVLNPLKPAKPAKAEPVAVALGMLSVLCAICAVFFSFFKRNTRLHP